MNSWWNRRARRVRRECWSTVRSREERAGRTALVLWAWFFGTMLVTLLLQQTGVIGQ